MLPVSVLHNPLLLPKHRGAGGQMHKLLVLSHHQWGSVDPHRKGKQLWAPLIHPCFQETSKPAKILKQRIEGLGCRLYEGPVAFGCECFVWVSRDQEQWSRRRASLRRSCVLWHCCLTGQAGGPDGWNQRWSSRPFSWAPAEAAVLLGSVAFRAVLRVMSRSSLLQSACLQGLFEHSSSELYRLKKRLVHYSHRNPAAPFGLILFLFFVDNEMTGLPRGDGGGEEGIDCLLVGLCVCRLACFSCMCALSKSSCSSWIYDKFICTKRFFHPCLFL